MVGYHNARCVSFVYGVLAGETTAWLLSWFGDVGFGFLDLAGARKRAPKDSDIVVLSLTNTQGVMYKVESLTSYNLLLKR